MNDDNGQNSLSYKDAGVDIDAGNALVERIKDISRRTTRPEVLGGLGGFGALCELPEGYRQPVLVKLDLNQVVRPHAILRFTSQQNQ